MTLPFKSLFMQLYQNCSVMFPFHFSLLRWNQAPLLNRQNAFISVQQRRGANWTCSPGNAALISESSGCSWLSLHALSGSLWASVHIWSDPPSPFYSLLLPFLLAFHFFSVSPASFYKSFMYLLWLLRVFVAFCSCCERGLLFIVVHEVLIAVASLIAEHGLQGAGSVVVVLGFSCPAAWGSSWTSYQTSVPCIDRWILNLCTTRGVPSCSSNVVVTPGWKIKCS